MTQYNHNYITDMTSKIGCNFRGVFFGGIFSTFWGSHACQSVKWPHLSDCIRGIHSSEGIVGSCGDLRTVWGCVWRGLNGVGWFGPTKMSFDVVCLEGHISGCVGQIILILSSSESLRFGDQFWGSAKNNYAENGHFLRFLNGGPFFFIGKRANRLIKKKIKKKLYKIPSIYICVCV